MRTPIAPLILALLLCQIAQAQLCSGNLSENLFPDGDFGSGAANILPNNPGIAPGYIYQTNPPPNDGFYSIANNTTNWGSFAASVWINIGDNSSDPNGYMMVVNATETPGIFYERNVEVCENTLYEFSADIINLFVPGLNGNLPNIDFLIDGDVVFSTGNVPENAEWQTYGFTFTTDVGVSEVTLSLVNNAPGGNGNDLALDNISFRVCGPEINLPDTLRICDGGPAILNAITNSAVFDTPFYQWQSSDNGTDWTNIDEATDSEFSTDNPVDGSYYRVIMANSAQNLNRTSCSIVSNPVYVAFSEAISLDRITIMSPNNCEAMDGEILVQASGGKPPLTFFLNGMDMGANSDFTNLNYGMYTVRIQDANGCFIQQFADLTNLDSPILEVVQTEDTNCGEMDGSIQIQASGGIGDLEYSIDGINYQDDPSFQNLAGGSYPASVRDRLGCVVESVVQVGESFPLDIQELNITRTTCGENNGAVAVTVTGGNGLVTYSIDGQNFMEGNSFFSLAGGDYSIQVQDETGCSDNQDTNVPSSDGIVLEDVTVIPTSCGQINGSILINATGGNGALRYSIDGAFFRDTPSFNNLLPGFYDAMVVDELDCEVIQQVEVLPSGAPAIAGVQSIPPNCGEANGQIVINAISDNPDIDYAISGFDFQVDSTFTNLERGIYTATIRSGACQDTQLVVLTQPFCLYVPNVFSPNDDGINDLFEVFSQDPVTIRIARIFDRWGGLVFEQTDAALEDSRWDGKKDGEELPVGTYVYFFEVESQSGEFTTVKGDVALIR